MEASNLQVSRKAILVVLFVPSVERDGLTSVNQDYWVEEALETFGRLYGGATAFPRARGVWRDDEMGGSWSRMSRWSFIATRRPRRSPILTVFPGLGVSVEEWVVKHIRGK